MTGSMNLDAPAVTAGTGSATGQHAVVPRPARTGEQDCRCYGEQAARLIAAVDGDPWGSVRPSLYETSRVLSFAPWLRAHEVRLTWVLEQQAADGSWGEGPPAYRLLPTLSAVEALLSTLLHTPVAEQDAARIAAAAAEGLSAVRDLSPDGPWPDTAAAEILVPHLVARINEHLGAATIRERTVFDEWSTEEGLPVPDGYQGSVPERVVRKCLAVGGVPLKLHHTYEGVARSVPAALAPAPEGLLGSSPAATAARVAALSPSDPLRLAAVTELEAVANRYGGLFPEAAPIRVFERLWVAAALAGPGGLSPSALATIRAWVDELYDPAGVRGAPGLMVDADDTAMTVLVALLAGEPRDPAPLAVFENGDHYDCYVGEDTGSVTANAHALQALGAHAASRPGTDRTYGPRIGEVRDWLIGRQRPDGSWTDKWHASPYYATERCVAGLAAHGGDPGAEATLAAADWVAETQRADGSWGVWDGTAEESAYAVKILLSLPAGMRTPRHTEALLRAEAFLRTWEPGRPHPALWHDKTLYAPQAMVDAEITATQELLRRHPATERTEHTACAHTSSGRADT